VAALSRRAPRPDADKPAAREEVKQKRIAERAAAREEHAEFMAKQAAAKPVKDRAYAEWKARTEGHFVLELILTRSPA
jgi:hypothetical protein